MTPTNNTTQQNPLVIRAQYTKDFSFENPNPLASFDPDKQNIQPAISVDIQAHAENLGGRNFEVVLEITVNASREEEKMFITELTYAGIATLDEHLNEDLFGDYLMVEAPRMLFPFARNIISDAIREGGYPPLMLAPVDFAALYQQQKQQPQQ